MNDAAARAARLMVLGVNVIPLAGKRPTEEWRRWTTERQLAALDDADAWIAERWGDHGLGAVTGRVSGIVVVDVDGDGGDELFATLCGDLGPTPIAGTKKGTHWWFAYPELGVRLPNRVRVQGAALDVRADGGYVVVPPSEHPDGGRYEWIVGPETAWPPAPMPTALRMACWPELYERRRDDAPAAPSISGQRTRYVETALANEIDRVRHAPIGARNDTLNVAAFNLSRFLPTGELGAREVATALLDAARAAGLPEHEARRTIASGFAVQQWAG